MIDWGLPDTREGWPSGVLDALRHWRQGDLVAQPPAFHYCDPEAAVWAGRPEGLDGPDVVDWGPLAPPLGIVTTQTCDVAEEDAPSPRRPFVQLAPVYDMSTELNSGFRRLLKQRRGPLYLFHVPEVEDGEAFFVADLRLEFPVDKGWLATLGGGSPASVTSSIASGSATGSVLFVSGRLSTGTSWRPFSSHSWMLSGAPRMTTLSSSRRSIRR